MRSALVTGGHGFIGRYLVSALQRAGVKVTLLGRPQGAESASTGSDRSLWDDVVLDRVLEDASPDTVFHLVGAVRGTRSELAHINVDLTRCVLRAVHRTGLRPLVVVAGSAAEYGAAIRDGEPVAETAVCMPLSTYGASKQAQTRVVLAYADATGNPALLARIFNPIGRDMPAHLAIGDFARQIASMSQDCTTLRVGNIDVRRDMIDVEHVAMLLCKLATTPEARGVVNVCSGEAPLLRNLVDMLIACSGRNVDIEVEEARMRANEVNTVIGSTERLAKLGCTPPPNDFPAVIARVWQGIEECMACAS